MEIITKKAFNNCSTLKTITLPLTLNKLCWLGFQGCENLHSIFIPNCVEYITEDAINSERDFQKTQQKTPNNIENSLQMIA